jgi:hypothetical protein
MTWIILRGSPPSRLEVLSPDRATLDHEVTMFNLTSACMGIVGIAAAATLAAQAPAPPNPVELKVGDAAPAFALQGSDGKIHKLSDYKGKTVVLALFPKAFTGG